MKAWALPSCAGCVLEEEKRKLKKLVADLSLDKLMLQDVLVKKFSAWSEAGDCSLCPARVRA
jgi:hypothetical protein